MTPRSTRRMSTIGMCLAAVTVWLGVATPAAAAAPRDSQPPSTPQNLHDISNAAARNAVLRWDPSTDDSGQIYHYWVLVDGSQRARPAAPTYDIQTLVNLCRITPGKHTITVQAVDRALNRSPQSTPIQIIVNL